ncbi:MAG: ABC transporter substrate-binding protein [Deltaproteobacteria bacterium]|nr:ABC transporter substrate-binding protein [Deltaproteobacteria bacterium]
MWIRSAGILLSGLSLFSIHPPLLFGVERIRVGLSSMSSLHGAVWVAEEKGIFKKHGVEPEIIVIGGGASRGVSALIAGDIQFVSGSGDAAINASLRGADVVIVASVVNKGVQRVMARAELKTPGDLKGKRVGVTRFGAASHLALGLMLRRWGIGPSDVGVVQVGSSPAMVASLDKGGIDAAVLSIPPAFIAEEKGYRVLADLAQMDIYYLHQILGSTRSYLRANRDAAGRFIRAFVEGIAFFKKNKRESLEVLRKKLRTDSEGEKHLEKSYDLLASTYYENIPYPSMQGVETVLDFLAKDNPKARGADPKSFVEDNILKALDASGFIKALY